MLSLSSAHPSDGPLLNKRALASRLHVSLPTLSAWLDKWADEFPVEQRGTTGREYLFHAEKVVDFLRAKQEEDPRSKAGKDEQLQQLFLPLGLTPVETENPGMSVRERLDAMKLAQMQATAERQAMENRTRAGQLVEASDVSELLAGCFLRWPPLAIRIPGGESRRSANGVWTSEKLCSPPERANF